jgi:hypothetical protein
MTFQSIFEWKAAKVCAIKLCDLLRIKMYTGTEMCCLQRRKPNMHLHKNLMCNNNNNNMADAQICEMELRLVPPKLDPEMVYGNSSSKNVLVLLR